MKTVRIRAGRVDVLADLNESATAVAVWDALPLRAQASTWGDEIYFSIPVRLHEEEAQATVQLGDLGYWPPGSALCIFYGPTPASGPGEIRPASPVNVFGRVRGDVTAFKAVLSGETVAVERA